MCLHPRVLTLSLPWTSYAVIDKMFTICIYRVLYNFLLKVRLLANAYKVLKSSILGQLNLFQTIFG